jgi:hypothetical protein
MKKEAVWVEPGSPHGHQAVAAAVRQPQAPGGALKVITRALSSKCFCWLWEETPVVNPGASSAGTWVFKRSAAEIGRNGNGVMTDWDPAQQQLWRWVCLHRVALTSLTPLAVGFTKICCFWGRVGL